MRSKRHRRETLSRSPILATVPSTMKKLTLLTSLLISSLALGFVPTGLKATYPCNHRTSGSPHALLDDHGGFSETALSKGSESSNSFTINGGMTVAALLPAFVLLTTSLPAEAAASAPVPSALWAYGHYFSIITIFGCLSAQKTLVKAGMTEEEENKVVKLDLVYGLMAALLIISGLFRATDYGKGSDFYLHETLFWVKMTFSGIWGGLSLFPSLTFYKRNFARKTETVPPVSDKLAARLQQVINAEITAVLSIPLLATLMSRGVWYWDDFPWPAGLATAILATIASFYLYGKQALSWTEDDVPLVSQEE